MSMSGTAMDVSMRLSLQWAQYPNTIAVNVNEAEVDRLSACSTHSVDVGHRQGLVNGGVMRRWSVDASLLHCSEDSQLWKRLRNAHLARSSHRIEPYLHFIPQQAL